MKKDGITADELATILGVQFWRTTIDVAANFYVVEICEFSEGVVTRSIVSLDSDHARSLKTGVTIILRSVDEEYQAAIRFSGGGSIMQRKTKVMQFSEGWGDGLPARVGFGDFPFHGEPGQYIDVNKLTDLRSYARGFLLRIRTV